MVLLLVATLIFQVLMTSGIVFYISKANHRDSNTAEMNKILP